LTRLKWIWKKWGIFAIEKKLWVFK
jgi:hypothetical protein